MIEASETRPVTIGTARFTVADTDRYRPFWDRATDGRWEPLTFSVLDRFLDPAHSCFDLGAWIGPTVLFGATRARAVYAFEPDPFARRELERNVALNRDAAQRVVVTGYCVTPHAGPIQMYAGGMYASPFSALGDSMTSFMGANGRDGCEALLADGITLYEFADQRGIRDCSFVKMDVEGAEFAILPAHQDYWRRTQPTLHVSFHAPPLQMRERCYRESLELLQSVYRYIYDASGTPLRLSALLDGISDWTDDSSGSAWARLDALTGTGIVASTAPW